MKTAPIRIIFRGYRGETPAEQIVEALVKEAVQRAVAGEKGLRYAEEAPSGPERGSGL
jgi:hypothetical protein